MLRDLGDVGKQLLGRFDGPFTFRLILQPLMATIYAVRAGLRDARAGRPPHLWTIMHQQEQRSHLLRESWREVRKVFIFAVLIDIVYEIVVFRWVYPLQPFIVATVLAVIPYLLLRSLVNRLASRYRSGAAERKRKAA
jgi:uncharacterized MAPEG superfamily protein